MPDFDLPDLPPRPLYFLLTSLVVPRPIAWVSSVSSAGVRNLAPHSYFNVVSANPPVVHFTSTGVKDSLRNVRETREFVVNIVSRDLAEAMNLTAADFPPEEDEFAWAGLATTPSRTVAPPRVAAARAALECRLHSVLSIGDGNMVFGQVQHIWVHDDVWHDGRVDPARLEPLGRLSGSLYAPVTEVFKLPRPTYEDVRSQAPR